MYASDSVKAGWTHLKVLQRHLVLVGDASKSVTVTHLKVYVEV